MLMRILKSIRGAILLSLLAIWMIFIALWILISAAFVFIVPWKTWRHYGMKYLLKCPVWWMDGNALLLKINTRKKWDIKYTDNLNPKGWYLMISNHRSWLDILMIGSFFNRKVPILKFFMKKQLLWSLPIAGLDCYILGYPFMERHHPSEIRRNPKLRGKDIQTTKKACAKFKQFPTTIINFVEGTRFREHKKLAQRSPFENLLKPKAGGTAIVLKEMHKCLDGIIDVTIYYEPDHISFWQFACGDFDKINIRYDVLPITDDLIGNYYEDRPFRIHFQKWLNEVWYKKDKLLNQFKADINADNEKNAP